jgi:signal transduction histidine kinase
MWFIIGGIVVLVAGSVDLVWTTLGTHGGGPISAPISKALWKVMISLHRRWPNHRLLSFGGSPILLTLLSFWLLLVWVGWVLIYSGSPTALIDSRSQRPVDFVERIYFTGAMMFTAGTSEFVPRGHAWHLVTAMANASGLLVVTLAITYLLAILGAIVEKRALASAIWDMGGTPDRIIGRAWTGERFADFDNPMTFLMTGIEKFAEQHLAYPILQYFHAENRRTAAPLRIAALHEALMLIAYGVAPEKRPPKLDTHSPLDAIRGFAEVIASEYVSESKEPPPQPDLAILRHHGIPTIDANEFALAIENARDVRRRLLGMIDEAGWTWSDVYNRELDP